MTRGDNGVWRWWTFVRLVQWTHPKCELCHQTDNVLVLETREVMVERSVDQT